MDLLFGLAITAACGVSCEAIKLRSFNLISGIIPVHQLVGFKIVFRNSRIAPFRKKKLIEGMEHAAVVVFVFVFVVRMLAFLKQFIDGGKVFLLYALFKGSPVQLFYHRAGEE